MLLYYFLINILFIPFILGTNKSTEINNSNQSLSSTKSRTLELEASNIKVPSEGGSILQNTPSLTLLKDNHTAPLLLDKDLGEISSDKPSTSKISPRKGVVYTEDNSTTVLHPAQIKHDNSTDHSKENIKPAHQPNTTTTIIKNNGNTDNKTRKESTIELKKVNKTEVSKNQTEVPKKPLVLSYEILASMDQQIPSNKLKIPAIQSSSKTMMHDQMPSPSKEDSESTTKIHPLSVNRHPDMIMPVVITILVVPMFAVLGYMALRRGQEAWKNRHYKRMDFLLDGMYND